MMLDREKLTFWTRVFAIGLSAVFIGSTIFFGVGSNFFYNPLDLIGGSSNQQSAGQSFDPQDQIEQAEKELQDNPEDPNAAQDLASLYLQNGQTDDAIRVLQKGREAAPNDEDTVLLLGQAYSQQAQAAAEEKERNELHGKAGDAFAAAVEVEKDNEDAYLFAGQSYEQAGETAEAIKYYNGYLDLEPQGQQSGQVKDRISSLLQGGETTGASGS
ncbi:MAG: tetratricopeptide repeat protein [Actinomycetota bacterium]|nr:tetratricopeptide repeat protein [Actinomycetota bacterium]